MPLSRADKPEIINAIHNLIRAVETAIGLDERSGDDGRYSEVAGRVNEAAQGVLRVLVPSKARPGGVDVNLSAPDPFPDITQSHFDLPVRAELKELAESCMCDYPHSAIRPPEATIVDLERVLAKLGESDPKSPPAPEHSEGDSAVPDRLEPNQIDTERLTDVNCPLVAMRSLRREPDRALARDSDHHRQARYCIGFDPDWFFSPLQAVKWKSIWYPLEATEESLTQWVKWTEDTATRYYGPFNLPERAAKLLADMEHDLQLIGQCWPQLVVGRRTVPPEAASVDSSQREPKQADKPAADVEKPLPLVPLSGGKSVPLSRLELPPIVEAIRELYRIIEHPPAKDWKAPDWLVKQYQQTTLGSAGVPKNPAHSFLIHAAATEVLNRMMPPWHHTKDDCPEITDSMLDQRHKVALIELRRNLLSPFASHRLANNKSDALEFGAYLETVLDRLGHNTHEQGKRKAGTSSQRTARPNRDPNQPSKDRQDDIRAAIRSSKTPLTRPELCTAMKLKTEGKLGHHLAWMVENKILVNIPGRGYWPVDLPVPE